MMIITHKLKMDLTKRGAPPRIPVVQGDTFSRRLAIFLFMENRPWKIPEGTVALIRYRRPNGDSGYYDTLPDGSRAVSCSGNQISILLAAEALRQAGTAAIMVTLLRGVRQLTTFTVELQVQGLYGADEADPQGTSWISGLLPAPDSAAPGQYFMVETVDEQGRVLSLKAVDAPTGDAEEIRNAIEEYLDGMDLSGGVSLTHSWNGTVLTVTSASGTSSADLKGEDGLTPYIGSNGNWWLGDTDTGTAAIVNVDSILDTLSENPIQNRTVASAISAIEAIFSSTVFPRLLPAVSETDNGKFLCVTGGAWTVASMEEWAGGAY